MSKAKSRVNDPDNYAAMSIPFESADAANEAMNGFHSELSALRKKYKIADVLVVTKGEVRTEDGEVGQFINHAHYGSSLQQLPMAAFAYGQLQKEQEEIIGKLLAGKTK